MMTPIDSRDLLYSKISCIADANVAPFVAAALDDLAIPEAFVQRAKQLSLTERSSLLGLRSRRVAAEDRAELIRFYAPKRYESGILRRVAEAADLYLPGRGSIFAEDALVRRGYEDAFDEERLAGLAPVETAKNETHSVLCCIVQRGMAESIALTVLEMGLCVPMVSFGEGMGLRNKLGLLRITIPVDKEVMYFIVPERDADLLEGVAVHKARLDRPGQGFIYRFPVRAQAVNLRVSRGRRDSAASMEQVIAALDELRGSSEWRRLSPAKRAQARPDSSSGSLLCLSIIAEEGAVGDFVRAAMDAGAGGATLVPLERRSYTKTAERSSHARETCDLIIPKAIADTVMAAIEARGLFEPGVHGIAELTQVGRAVTYLG